MFRRFRFVVYALALLQGLPPQVIAGEQLQRIFKVLPWSHDDVGKKPHTGKDTCVEELAKNIDWLEGQIDVFGTVVAKTPDVWGEARLTAHRQEFEEVLRAELRAFNKNELNGAEFVQDQAFLQFAFAMNARATGVTQANQVPFPQITMNAGSTAVSTPPAKEGETSPVTVQSTFTPQKVFGFEANSIALGQTLKLEQTEVIDQLARYVNHLHQHRRINEGDDTSDAPGYALNLVRIPISVMPGQRTKSGFGAEITVTAEPYLGPELLPMAYRDLVLNDLVDQLSVPLTRFINADPVETKRLMDGFARYEEGLDTIRKLNQQIAANENLLPADAQGLARAQLDKEGRTLEFLANDGTLTGKRIRSIDDAHAFNAEVAILINAVFASDNSLVAKTVHAFQSKAMTQRRPTRSPNIAPSKVAESIESVQSLYKDDLAGKDLKEFEAAKDKLKVEIIEQASDGLRSKLQFDFSGLTKNLPTVSIPASTTRRATLPFPPTQIIDNYGLHEMAHLLQDVYKAFELDVVNRHVAHVTDVAAFIKEETGAAHELLLTSGMQHWWTEAEPRELYELVRRRDTRAICVMRERFLADIRAASAKPCPTPVPEQDCPLKDDCLDLAPECAPLCHHSTAALAWCIYVESLLLNERLLQDMRETFGNRPDAPVCPDWIAFYGPNPCEEARMLFAEYVRIRWPLRVFALDPVVTEQNIGDIRSIYRQMQMSIALSLAQGQMSTSAAMQAMRKLQRDRATIDLNRTAVGFGHGDDTFGWRFYPRFQTMPVESNTTVLLRDLVVGGPTDKQLEKGREIEPGMRECVAIVLMPSFVPHVRFSTRGNWFKLGCNGRTASSISDTVEFSRAVKHMQTSAVECVKCEHLYRDGEVERLLKRVHQLDRKLPLQTLDCQVPIENTHGGFEIFSAGTRELAPELTGWYGAPGYDPSRACRFFLSGDNFNVTTTSLVVGNQQIPFRLLSRQIMEVTLPAGLAVLRDGNLTPDNPYEGYVDAHVATPYGVSGHLLIPVVRQGPAPLPRSVMTPVQLHIAAKGVKTGDGPYVVTLAPPASWPISLAEVQVPRVAGFPAPAQLIIFPVCGHDRLKPVPMALSKSAPAIYEVAPGEADIQLKGDGPLAKSLGHYLDYMVNVAGSQDALFEFDAAAALTGDLPVDGSMEIHVHMTYEKKPAAKP